MIVSGGWLKLQGLAEYKTHKNKWKVCPAMANGRCGHVMVSVNNSVFVLGGRDGKAPAMTNIEEYNLDNEFFI
jgi:N-acetylneuraminic acid mutarotase